MKAHVHHYSSLYSSVQPDRVDVLNVQIACSLISKLSSVSFLNKDKLKELHAMF